MKIRSLCVLLCSVLTASAAELAVKKVALYKHGVGFYVRSGEITDGDPARLELKASEMDDVLKSLTLVQEGGEGVAAVRYDSADPLDKRLESFAFRVGSKASTADILDQFKGAHVAVRAGGQAVEGVVVSARSFEDAEGAERQELLLMSDAGELRSIDPRAVESMRFVDEELQESFREYLRIVAESRNSERRSLILESSGGASRVRAAYLAPAAIWKSSYRLILRDGEAALLEGWAIVDNTSSDDWESVELSLVSGLPVSFVNELYAPRYVERNRVELKQDKAWRPIIHGAAVDVLPPRAPASSSVDFGSGSGSIQGTVMDRSGAVIPMAIVIAEGPGGRSFTATSGPDGGFRMAGLPAGEYDVNIESAGFRQYRTRVRVDAGASLMTAILQLGTVTETAASLNTERSMVRQYGSTVEEDLFEGENMGDLFAYSIRRPVTVPAGQSAMLPFYSGEVEGRRLLIYNEDYGSQHPLNAFEIANRSGGALDGGAMTVYDGGGYAGEAMMDTLKSGDQRLVSYAVDLGVRITSRFRSESKTQRELHARNGMLLMRSIEHNRKTFLIRNVDSKAKTLWIEHEPAEGFEPVNVEPSERTADALRFEVSLAPDSTTEFVLEEERPQTSSAYLSNLDYDEVIWYAENKDYDEASRARLAEIAQRLKEVEDAESESDLLEGELSAVRAEQERLRGNISTLNSVAGQQARVQAMAERLAENEGRIQGLEQRIREADARAEALEERLEAELETASF